MEWFNLTGLVFVIILLVPNIIFAMKHKDGFETSITTRPLKRLSKLGVSVVFAVCHITISYKNAVL